MPTAIVPLSSDLKRKAWMREGLIQSASKSFWSSMTGTTADSVVYQRNNENAAEGHTVVFDFDGALSGKAIKGKEAAYGKGEQKRKFSDKLTVERYRLVVDNGDKFDGIDIGDLSINEHSDSRAKLGDLFVRFKDQMLFDAAQGTAKTATTGAHQPPSHIIDLGATFDFNTLTDISTTLRTSQGFSTGGIRRPLKPYMVNGDKPMWIYVMDAAMAAVLRKDTAGFQTIMKDADVRGEQNRLIKGVLGTIGNLILVEADQFFGSTAGTKAGEFGFEDSAIEISGLRQYAGANPATAIWTGQEGFDYASAELHSRGLILGAGALQFGMGKQPDYKFKSSQDFDIKSESAVEFWAEARKTNLLAENTDYNQAKVAGLDFGVIAVDLKVA